MIDILLVVIAYLLGSIPSSVWIGKRFFAVDVRQHGSGNSGATNTLRILGKKAGFAVLIVDILKGWLAVKLSAMSHQSSAISQIQLEVALASAAILGHIFPIYARFKGGKGVATTMGVIIAFSPVAGMLCLLIFIIVLLLFHYVSVASMIAILSFPLWMAITIHNPDSHREQFTIHNWLSVFSILLPLLVIFMHRKNIVRLMKKQESKLSFFKKKEQPLT